MNLKVPFRSLSFTSSVENKASNVFCYLFFHLNVDRNFTDNYDFSLKL